MPGDIREAWTKKYEENYDKIDWSDGNKKKKNKEYKSDCCNAKVIFSDRSPDFLGDSPITMKVGTVCPWCTKCGKPCNIKENK